MDPPLPPDELIDRVTAGVTETNAEEIREGFRRTGRQSVADIERALGAVGRTLESYPSVLEFGCGCGRIIAWLEPLAKHCALHGTDIDGAAIAWCARELPFAEFGVNPHEPPMGYADASFDLVFNHSVFTHLDERHQDMWLAELRRITKPGGTVVLTVHGEHAFDDVEASSGADAAGWRERLERDGILFIEDDAFVGSAFPSFYHTTFHAPWYVHEHWGRTFSIRAYLPRAGLDYQDIVVLERTSGDRPAPRPVRARPGGAASPSQQRATVDPAKGTALARAEAELEREVAPRHASRFGRPGELARRLVLRLIRPYTSMERALDRDLAQAIRDARRELDELRTALAEGQRMPPVVKEVLERQAQRIKRLEADLRLEVARLAERVERDA